jgi:alkanesulfonate monooxygenase SsuD/methylene tetrahydromethanopterin reductase-like flavin-dependent oxidoreductase (luciferase family)
VILRLWAEEGRVTYRGRYYRVVEAPFWPKPVQKPHPPIWFGGSSKAILEAAVKYGYGFLLLSNTPVKDFGRMASHINEMSKKLGKRVLLAPSVTYPDGIGENPKDWLSKIEEYSEAGADMIILDFSMTKVSPDKSMNMLKEFSKAVFPIYCPSIQT